MTDKKKEREPYVPPPKTKEQIRAMWFDVIGMVTAAIVFFGLFIWLAFNI